MALRLETSDPAFSDAFDLFVAKSREQKAGVDKVVGEILSEVKERGDEAVIDYTRRFDRHDVTTDGFEFSQDEITTAEQECDDQVLGAIKDAEQRVRAYHERQMPLGMNFRDSSGVELGYRYTAVESAGLYIPGGTAALFSSILMNAIPAKVAGVDKLVATMPTPDGGISPLMLATCRIAGVDTVYRLGGAQAIAALAYGTDTILPVDKIAGPGNIYVTTAKRMVFGTVGVDMIAGPSEVTIVADDNNDPEWIAADLLAQAEHDVSSRSVLITDDHEFATAVEDAIEKYLKVLPRASTAGKSWADNGGIFVVDDISLSPMLVNQIAPEHLQLSVSEYEPLLAAVRHAGSIFVGRYTPEAIGDYIAGPSHVLPTSGSARFSSGLSVFDFLKRTSIINCSAGGLGIIGPKALVMARAEDLEAHAMSVDLRLNKLSDTGG